MSPFTERYHLVRHSHSNELVSAPHRHRPLADHFENRECHALYKVAESAFQGFLVQRMYSLFCLANFGVYSHRSSIISQTTSSYFRNVGGEPTVKSASTFLTRSAENEFDTESCDGDSRGSRECRSRERFRRRRIRRRQWFQIQSLAIINYSNFISTMISGSWFHFRVFALLDNCKHSYCHYFSTFKRGHFIWWHWQIGHLKIDHMISSKELQQ